MMPFDKFFDFNHDGKLDLFEQSMEYSSFAAMEEEELARKKEKEDHENHHNDWNY